jgi:hypothetical protein
MRRKPPPPKLAISFLAPNWPEKPRPEKPRPENLSPALPLPGSFPPLVFRPAPFALICPLQVECPHTRTKMDSARELGKLLVVCGLVLAVAGCFLAFSGKLPFRLGRLPGDISYKGENSSFYFPIVTCILLSAALTLIMWIVNHFRR